MLPTSPAMDDELTAGVPAQRVLAWVVDHGLILCLVGLLWMMVLAFGLITFGLTLPLLMLLPVVPFAYCVLFVAGGMSATPGQAMMGLSVRRNDDLGPPGIGQVCLYTAGLYATAMMGGVWFGIALITPRHRAAHDIVAGLVVVRRDTLTRGFAPWNIHGGSRP